jgi:predicted amidohydrolase
VIIAAVHFTPAFGELERNRAELVRLSAEAADRGAELVVLPELATTGFCLDEARANAWAEPADGATATALGELAASRGLVVVVGLALREEGALRNAQLVLDGGRLAGVYAKHHLFGADHAWAVAGEEPGAVATTSAGDVGLLICHDIVYPRTLLAVCARRPRLLAFSTAWIGTGETFPHSWSLAARLLDPAPLVVANRGGAEGEVAFEDPSAIVSYRSGGVVGPRSAGARVLLAEL